MLSRQDNTICVRQRASPYSTLDQVIGSCPWSWSIERCCWHVFARASIVRDVENIFIHHLLAVVEMCNLKQLVVNIGMSYRDTDSLLSSVNLINAAPCGGVHSISPKLYIKIARKTSPYMVLVLEILLQGREPMFTIRKSNLLGIVACLII